VPSKRKRRREREPESVKEWRRRIETTEAQQVFSLRKLIERVNAHLKNHGFGFMPVRASPRPKRWRCGMPSPTI